MFKNVISNSSVQLLSIYEWCVEFKLYGIGHLESVAAGTHMAAKTGYPFVYPGDDPLDAKFPRCIFERHFFEVIGGRDENGEVY